MDQQRIAGAGQQRMAWSKPLLTLSLVLMGNWAFLALVLVLLPIADGWVGLLLAIAGLVVSVGSLVCLFALLGRVTGLWRKSRGQ